MKNKVNTDRDMISLEEALSYLKYLNKEQPFHQEEIQFPTNDYGDVSQTQRKKITLEKVKKDVDENQEDQDFKKKINKNRAIKRIIQSSFQILKNFKTYEDQEHLRENASEKSAALQFNIYLKQYNRVLELIYKKEKEELQKQAEREENREEGLQNIYEYTVVQDFRQILPIATLKDKVSKINIEIMMEALKQCLIILKTNELRIYENATGTGNFKTIKLHEIENVDYHIQPYIFIVLTIQKDKEKSNLYIKFDSEKNQDKWDRALYCCYISRKMKKKDKLFSIQYPEEDVIKKEKEEIKKVAAFTYEGSYENKKGAIDRILNEKKYNYKSQRSQKDQNSSEQNQSHGISYLNSKDKKEITEKSMTGLIKLNKSSQSISGNEKNEQFDDNKSSLSRGMNLKETKSKNANEDLSTPLNRNKTDNESLINRNKTDYIIKQNPYLEKDFTQRPNGHDDIQNEDLPKEIPFHQENFEEETPHNKSIQLPEEIKRIHDIERKNVKGLIMQKDRFFSNKLKILFFKENITQNSSQEKKAEENKQPKQIDLNKQYEALREREIEYWDYEKDSGIKSERKIIKIMKISKMVPNNEKKSLFLQHENEKEITFISPDLKEIQELQTWIELIQYADKHKPLNLLFA